MKIPEFYLYKLTRQHSLSKCACILIIYNYKESLHLQISPNSQQAKAKRKFISYSPMECWKTASKFLKMNFSVLILIKPK